MKHAFSYSMAFVREALALYQTPLSYKSVQREIELRHGVGPNYQTISNWVKAAGIKRPLVASRALAAKTARGKDYDAIRREAARMIFDEALTIHAAATRLGVSSRTIRRIVPASIRQSRSEAISAAWWQSLTPRVNRRRAVRDEVIRMRQDGMSYRAIMARCGLSKTTVQNYLIYGGCVTHRTPLKVAA